MSNSVITEELENAIVIRFNRPEIRSPLSIEVLDELSRVLHEVENGRAAERIIFTGTGSVFASGADLREIARLDEHTAREFGQRGQDLMQRIARIDMPTVAAINGVCFGGALDLALACNLRIAIPDAVFCHPGVGLGIMTGWGGTQRLPRLIGTARALEMFFTARRVTAGEALSLGLIDSISHNLIEQSLVT
jgi:enoyl-CoA hydratase